MKLISNAFKDNEAIPVKYAKQGVAGGENVSIPLSWEDAPAGTKSFALAMIDINSRNWVHWMVINIPAEVTSIPEGASGANMPGGSKELINTFGSIGYGGPEPPPGAQAHNYVITLYALDVEEVSLAVETSFNEFLQAVEGRTLAKASLTGKFAW